MTAPVPEVGKPVLPVRRPRSGTVLLERAHLTWSGVSVLAFVVLGWFVARSLGSRTTYLLVYAGLLVMVVSAVAARRKLAVDVERSRLPSRMRVGQQSSVTLTITGRRRASTIVVQDALPESFGRTPLLSLASLAGGQQVEHAYSLTPARRGVFSVGPCVATWNDPFGLTTHSQELAQNIDVIVHPEVEHVRDRVLSRMWEDPPIRPPVSKPWPVGFEFYGMRDYVPGDDLRRVVWSAVAKTGKMLVRESEQGITDRVALFMDTDRSWHKPGVPSDTFEAAVRVIAAVGVHHLAEGFSVTFGTNEGTLRQNLRGPKARMVLLDELARVQQSRLPLTSIGPALLREARHGSHFLIVTPHLDKRTASQLRLVLERGASVVIVKIVWDESDPQSLERALTLGCQVVQVPTDGSVEGAFRHQSGAGVRA